MNCDIPFILSKDNLTNFSDKAKNTISRNQKSELETSSERQTKIAVEKVKQVKRSKDMPAAEQSRLIKEIRHTNAKQHVAQMEALRSKHAQQDQNFKTVNEEKSRLYTQYLEMELAYWEEEWHKVPYKKRKSSSLLTGDIRVNGSIFNTLDQTVRRLRRACKIYA